MVTFAHHLSSLKDGVDGGGPRGEPGGFIEQVGGVYRRFSPEQHTHGHIWRARKTGHKLEQFKLQRIVVVELPEWADYIVDCDFIDLTDLSDEEKHHGAALVAY